MSDQYDRQWAYEHRRLLRTHETIARLHAETGFPDELIGAVIRTWVALIRHEALSMAKHDRAFRWAVESGEGLLLLNNELAPEGWESGSLQTLISNATGLSSPQVTKLLSLVAEGFGAIRGAKAFEPVGWVEIAEEPSALEDRVQQTFVVHCWKDFLEPVDSQATQDRFIYRTQSQRREQKKI